MIHIIRSTGSDTSVGNGELDKSEFPRFVPIWAHINLCFLPSLSRQKGSKLPNINGIGDNRRWNRGKLEGFGRMIVRLRAFDGGSTSMRCCRDCSSSITKRSRSTHNGARAKKKVNSITEGSTLPEIVIVYNVAEGAGLPRGIGEHI